jgi:hypothetical protein
VPHWPYSEATLAGRRVRFLGCSYRASLRPAGRASREERCGGRRPTDAPKTWPGWTAARLNGAPSPALARSWGGLCGVGHPGFVPLPASRRKANHRTGIFAPP